MNGLEVLTFLYISTEMLYSTKKIATPEISVKDLDTKQGIVRGYFAAFGNKDSDGDIIMKGAFAKTIAENKQRFQHLFNHNPDHLIGKIMEIGEDETGLYFTSQMSKTDEGQRALIRYEEGILREHSIGFNVIRYETDREAAATRLTELKLYEGSAVTWGANEQTPVTEIKSTDVILKVHNLLEKLEKSLKNPLMSDRIGKETEAAILKIKNLLSTQFEGTPEVPPAVEIAPDELTTIIRSTLKF